MSQPHPLLEDYKLEIASLKAQQALIEARVFTPRSGPQLATDDDRAKALAQIANAITEYKAIIAGGSNAVSPTLK